MPPSGGGGDVRSPLNYNGTFFNNIDMFPHLGYNRVAADPRSQRAPQARPRRRAAHGEARRRIGARQHRLPGCRLDQLRDRPSAPARTRSRSRRATCSASGREDGRRYFHYKMDRPMLPFFCYLSARWEVKRGDWHGRADRDLLRRQAPVQRRPHDRGDAEVARLLHDALLAVPAPAGAHPRVPALRALRAELRQHDPVLRIDRLHRRPARSRRHRLRLLRHRARGRAPVVGAPGDRRGRAGRDHARRVAVAVLGADGDGEGVRPRADAPLPASTSSIATCAAAAAS